MTVGLMGLAEQAKAHNLLTRAGFQAQQSLYQEEALNRELGRPAGEIRLGEVVRAFEGNLHLLDCVGIDDVFGQVVGVRASRAGEVGADLAALAVERVAHGADALENKAALAEISTGEFRRSPPRQRPVGRHQRHRRSRHLQCLADGESDRRNFGCLRAQIFDFAFNAKNGLEPVVGGDRVEMFEREPAQIDGQAEDSVSRRRARPELYDFAAEPDDGHYRQDESQAGAKFHKRAREARLRRRPNERKLRRGRRCGWIGEADRFVTMRGINGNLGRIHRSVIETARFRVLAIWRDKPNRIAARADGAPPRRTEDGLDDMIGFPAAGTIDQHGSVSTCMR